ncbi:MAG: DUF2339 domain-containing protein [Lachnospirales bacterium]
MKVDDLKNILEEQKSTLDKLSNVVKDFDDSKVIQERDIYYNKACKLEEEIKSLKEEVSILQNEKNQLKDKIFDLHYKDKQGKVINKIDALNNFKEKNFLEYEKELFNMEKDIQKIILSSVDKIKKEDTNDLQNELDKLVLFEKEIRNKIRQKRETARELNKDFNNIIENSGKGIIKNKISEEDIQKSIKSFNFELKIGGRVTQAIGMLFIMFALISGGYLVYDFFGVTLNDTMKTILMFLVGIVFLLLSEVMKKRVSRFFSLGLIGGGIGVLYLSTAFGYFIFDGVLTSATTMVLIILISILAFLLSVKNESKTIAVFSLIGGYLPIIDFNLTASFVTGMAIYVFVLNMLVLLVSIKKDWKAVKYIAFALNTVVMVPFISIIIFNEFWGVIPIILFILIIYIVAILTTLYYPYKRELFLLKVDKALLVLNTLIFSTFNLMIIFYFVDEKYMGFAILPLFAIFYIMAKVVERFLPKEKGIYNFYYIISFIFTFIALPVQLEGNVAFMAVMLEVTALLCYGIYFDRKIFHSLGKIGLFLISLIHFNFIAPISSLILVLSYIFVLVTYYYKNKINEDFENIEGKEFIIYKNFVILAIYWYIIYFIYNYLYIYEDLRGMLDSYALQIIIVLISLINIAISRQKWILDIKTSRAICVYNVLILLLIFSNFLASNTNVLGLIFTAIAFCIYLFNFKLYIDKSIYNKDFRFISLGVGSIIVFNSIFTHNNVYNFYDTYYSICSLIVTFIFIYLGFKNNCAYLRKVMLGLTYIFIIKIFFFDMNFSTSIERVIAYFMFGIILILISFVYQKFSKSVYKELDDILLENKE